MKIGIVGLPNVGKSTLFNALTKSYGAQAGNFPFCTIDPNIGRVDVNDKRLDILKDIVQWEKTVPANVEFVDIAGLVAGASTGEGLGNKFLANIREVDAILQVVRHFEDDDVHHVSGSIDAKRDREIINTELILADLDTLHKQITSLEKKAKGNDKEAKIKVEIGKKIIDALSKECLARSVDLSEEEKEFTKEFHLLTMKPFIYAVNVQEDAINTPEMELRTVVGVHDENISVCAICAKLEIDMMDLTNEEREEFLADMDIEKNPTDELIRTCFEALGLQYFFTAGVQEVRAWTVKTWATAPQAAGRIHSDFEKKFVKAEVVSYEDFKTEGGWVKSRENGKARMEGKEYIVQEGDVILFKHG